MPILRKRKSLRRIVHDTLHRPSGLLGRIINAIIITLIILSISAIPIYFLPNTESTIEKLYFFDTIVVILFTIEYILRIWSAPRPLVYILSWSSVVDVASILPYYLYMIDIIQDPHLFLMLRVLRMLKLGKTVSIERVSVSQIAKKSKNNLNVIRDEKIQHIMHKHPAVFFVTMIPPLMFTSIGLIVLTLFEPESVVISVSTVCFVFSFMFFIKAWINFYFDVIYITSKRIIIQNRQLFGSTLDDIAYEAITNITPDNTGIIRFLFGFGDIQIKTAAAGDKTFRNIVNPHGVMSKISKNRQMVLDTHKDLNGISATRG